MAFIYDVLRTPRGKGNPSGSLYEVRSIDLLVTVMKAIEQRNQLDTSLIDDVVIGCVTPLAGQGGDIAKAAALYAGWDNNVPGMQINRFSASGLEAVNIAAMKIRSGWESLVVAGGVESMSRVYMESDGGALLFDPDVISKVGYVPQGVGADLIATVEGYSREMIDIYAVASQRRAFHARENGFFDKSIVPIKDRNGLSILEKDEYLRPGTKLEKLKALKPSFAEIGESGFDDMALRKYPVVERIKHVHTAGNSSGIVDGAALVLLGDEAAGKKLNLKPRAKILSAASISSEPTIMLLGAAPAAQKALKHAGMQASDIDLWEMNEAFAAPVLKFQQELNIDLDILNVNGGAIALGHPQGAIGAMLMGTLLDELERRNLSTGLVALCVGGGMGVATIIERL